MTGGEIIGAGAAAKAAGAHIIGAIAPGAEDRKQMREITKDSKATEVAAFSRADRQAIVQMAVTKLFAPLAKWVGYTSQYFAEDFHRDMAEKLADVPEERLVTPEPIIAAQAVEGLGFSLDEPDLKDMYLNLLATASDSATASKAHPSFAPIIKQLSATEAAELLQVAELNRRPFVNFKVVWPDGRSRLLVADVYNTATTVDGVRTPARVPQLSLYLDNWERLGLIDRSTSEWIAADSFYEYAPARPEYKEAQARIEDEGLTDGELTIERGRLRVTAFGRAFVEAVRPRPNPEVSE